MKKKAYTRTKRLDTIPKTWIVTLNMVIGDWSCWNGCVKKSEVERDCNYGGVFCSQAVVCKRRQCLPQFFDGQWKPISYPTLWIWGGPWQLQGQRICIGYICWSNRYIYGGATIVGPTYIFSLENYICWSKIYGGATIVDRANILSFVRIDLPPIIDSNHAIKLDNDKRGLPF